MLLQLPSPAPAVGVPIISEIVYVKSRINEKKKIRMKVTDNTVVP